MAFWVAGGDARPLSRGTDNILAVEPYLAGGKRRVGHPDEYEFYDDHDHDYYDDIPLPKRLRLSRHTPESDPRSRPQESLTCSNLPSFLVIREETSPTPPTPERSNVDIATSSMERTASGLSISSDTSIYDTADDDIALLDDDTAARMVEERLQLSRRRKKDTQHERILRSLIRPRSRHAEFSIDNAALESIFSAANEIFFHNCLSRRVTWDWSHASSAQYEDHIIGTTALRRSKMGGFETLIVLSNPILKNKKYNRRLLISTFLHELIHSYLFIKCGIKARHCGGHTPGFRRIAELIDLWSGSDTLHLRDMEADLDHFREDDDYEEPSAPSPRMVFHGSQSYLIPHRHGHDQHSPERLERSRHRIPNQWDYCINDHREYFPVSRSSSPTSTIPTMEGDCAEVEPLEDGEIRETRGRTFYHDDFAPSRHSSAYQEWHYDSYDSRRVRFDQRSGSAVVSYNSTPDSIIVIR
ncbi:hypothetical protein C8034_v008699 [Colletotrichum sidae]|uniref:SprT-like domain-containing protein n=1 Tax=Colletotrichum sidae TaxID=1347389 RepID=A0A4V3I1N7_9PEZI|nr:hypothetical protein C8034_v008699 [Colletotrichum sidae]